LRTRAALPNLYRFQPASPPPDAAVTALIEKQMTREPTAYDSHPSSRQRVDWAEALAVPHEPQPGDDDPIWDLFTDREQLERRMTAEVRDRIRAQRSIEIPAGA
jgi:hypothetical protein